MTRRVPPGFVLKAFDDMAGAQRGRPERAMGAAQWAMGGGVLNFAIEHTGDLTNRMAKKMHITYLGDAGLEYVDDKVRKVLRTIRWPYGFKREHEENMVNNKVDRAKVDRLLRRYADEHRKLPVFNLMQWNAREAAVALGEQNFPKAEAHLAEIEKVLDQDDAAWYAAATEFTLDREGKLQVIVSGGWP